MPDRSVTVRVNLEGLEEASASTQKFGDALKGVGDTAQATAAPAAAMTDAIDKAGASLGKTGEAAKKAVGDLAPFTVGAAELTGALKDRLAPAAEAAFAAFQKLSNAETPRALTRAIFEAEGATERFQKAIDAAAASGEKMPPKVQASVAVMTKTIQDANEKLGVMKDRLGDISSRADQAGQSFKFLQSAGGGATGMLSALEGSSSGAVSSIGKLGLGVLGTAGIFGTAVAAGKGLGAAIDFVAGKQEKLADSQLRHRAEMEKTAAAISAAEKGHIALGGSLADLVRRYELFAIAQGRGTAETLRYAAALAGMKVAGEAFGELEKKAEAMAAVLSGAFRRSRQEGLEMAKVNEAALREMEAAYRRAGEVVPEEIRKAIKALDDYTGRFKALAEAQAEANRKSVEFSKSADVVGAALQKIQQEFQKEADAARKATGEVVAARDQQIKTLREAGLSEEEYFTRKKAILEQADALIVENSAKEQAARAKEKAAVADLSLAYDKTGKALADLGEKYVENQKKRDAMIAGDESLVRLQDALADSTTTYGESAGHAAAMTDSLHDALSRVATKVEELGQ